MFDSYDEPDLEKSIKKHLKGELPPIKYKDRLTPDEIKSCKDSANELIRYRIDAPEYTNEKSNPQS